MKLSTIAFSFLGLTLSAATSAASYSYRLPQLGSDDQDLEGCRSRLKQIADSFSNAVGNSANIVSFDCVRSNARRTGLDGEIFYLSSSPVDVSTSDARGIDPFYFYSSPAECQRGLSHELPIFQAATGLNPIATYCYRADRMSATSYVSRIDAVGRSDVKKFSVSVILSQDLDRPGAIRSELLRQANAKGLKVVEANFIAGVGSDRRFGMDYYATKKHHLLADRKLYYSNISDCRAAVQELETNWSSTTFKLAFGCSLTQGISEMEYLWISDNLAGDLKDFKAQTLPAAYSSQAVCNADRQRVLDSFAQSGIRTFGAICGLSGISSQMVVFSAFKGDAL